SAVAGVVAGPAPAPPAPGLPATAPPAVSRAASPAASPAARPAMPDGDGTVNPADLEPAVAPAAGTAPDTDRAGLRHYAELAATLPPLRLDLHVYATNPAERYAFINMHKVHEGDVTPEGARVSQITREGVVLDYRGTEFLLGRE
ncbi:MAG TPA: general secretion pathway protein GspB, partial [Steroidobacteraceae bacterium]|nr:general secretion pathway protein GspB [Steroidobacteraceae bacterium]